MGRLVYSCQNLSPNTLKQMISKSKQLDKTSVWEVIPNPDPSNLTGCTKCGCSQTFAVRHSDGGIIRFYNGYTMSREQAEQLKRELEMN